MSTYNCIDDVSVVGVKFTVAYEYEAYTDQGEQHVYLYIETVTVEGNEANLYPHLSDMTRRIIKESLIDDIKGNML